MRKACVVESPPPKNRQAGCTRCKAEGSVGGEIEADDPPQRVLH